MAALRVDRAMPVGIADWHGSSKVAAAGSPTTRVDVRPDPSVLGRQMRYAILGPVEVTAGTQTVKLERPQRRALLALLLLHANQVISIEQLIEALWGGTPPATARAQMHALVAAVRRTLREAGAEDAITTRAGGYMITVPDGACDVEVFKNRIARARAAADPDEAARLLRDALGLWRGLALDGVSAAYVDAARAALEEQRLAAHEQIADIELAQGRHAELVPELTGLVAAHPLRERLVGQLMVALYRSGRQSEALQTARALRRRLADEEGLDPGPALVELEMAILRADSGLAGPATGTTARTAQGASRPRVAAPETTPTVVPRQLPAVSGPIVGHREHLQRLDALLSSGDDAPDASPAVATITGIGGAGKTTLAVRWAHRVKDRFPDGHLYLDLRYGAVSTAEAVDEALRAFAVPGEHLPTDAGGALEAYRSLLGARRVLVLLDNAGDDEQARALLPLDGRSVVLVTGRSPSVVGARIDLDAFGPDEAAHLVAVLAGARRVDDEPAAIDQLAGACGRLPLTLAIAGASLAGHPERSVAEQVARVAAELAPASSDREQPSEVGAAVRAACKDLPSPDRRLIHLIAVAPVDSVTARSAAALADDPVEETARALARLTAARLLAEPVQGRFTIHESVRRCAADPDPSAPTDDDAAATGRLLSYHLCAVDAAAQLLYPQIGRMAMPQTAEGPGSETFVTPTQAMTWLETERRNLLAAMRHAAQHGPRPVAWLLADALRGYFALAHRTADWRAAAQCALDAAEADSDRDARSAAHLSLAELHLRSSQHPDAWQEAWRVLTAIQDRVPLAKSDHPGTGAATRRGPARIRSVVAVLVLLMVCTLAGSSMPTMASRASRDHGPATVVTEWTVAGLRQDEAIDFDAAGKQAFDDVPGVDVNPWGSGNHLSGESDALLAWLPANSPRTYAGCSAVPVNKRVRMLSGLHGVPDGQHICVWTKPGHVVMLTLTRAPRQQLPDVVFDYVVWRGTAPPSRPKAYVPPDTEIDRYAISNITDDKGVDFDPGGGVVSKDASGVDLWSQSQANAMKVMSGNLITMLPNGAPGTYQTCADVPQDKRKVGVGSLYDKAPGTRICVYLYSGRVVLLTLASTPSAAIPEIAFYAVVWHGTNGAQPVATEPPPWIRAPLSPGETASKVRKTRQ